MAPHFSQFPTPLGWFWVIGGIIAAGLSVLAVIGVVPVWAAGNWPVWRRLRYSALALISASVAGLFYYWNMLGVHVLG